MSTQVTPEAVYLDLNAPLEVARSKPLVAWLLAIPHFFVLYVLWCVNSVLVFIAFFTVLFTGNIPRGMFDFMAMIHRYQWRTLSYLMFMRDPYPAFEYTAAAADPGGDPAVVDIEYPERLSRGLPLVKWLLAVPHYFALAFVGLAAYFVVFIAWFAVLFTGSWPAGMREFVVGTMRWSMRVQVYLNLMTDEYPPFSLK